VDFEDELLDREITIAIVGGTGNLGTALAYRLAKPGIRLIIGSRDEAKATAVVTSLRETIKEGKLEGKDNLGAVWDSEIVVIAVPYDGHARTLMDIKEAVAGKVVIDAVVPLKKGRAFVPPAGSALLEAQEIIGATAHLVGAFHHISAVDLQSSKASLGDVLICGDDDKAKQTATEVIERVGARALDAGPACHAYIIEGMTGVLIHLNRKYKSKHASLKVTGI
jgi:NADPH-dependent F420 reductase